MAHRVPYVARIDWIRRSVCSNAVFWHTLAPDKLEPPYSVPVSLKIQYRSHQICAHYVVLGNADSMASTYSYSESGCLDTGSFAYGSIDIVSVCTLLSASVFWTSIPDSTHLFDITILVCAHPVSLIRYQLIGMRNVSISVMEYLLIGMQYVSATLIRYHLAGMQYIPISLTTYRLSDMQYISATFIMYHHTGMQMLVSANGFRKLHTI